MEKRMASEIENPFGRLPTGLIIYILETISDVKSMCLCYSVSKFFASIVPRTRFVSLQIATVMGSSGVLTAVWPPGVLNFLKKLSCVQHATIQFYPSTARSYSGPLVRWKSGSSGFILVAAKNRVDAGSDDEPSDGFTTTEYRLAILESMSHHLYHLRMRIVVTKELAQVFPSLKKVSAVEYVDQRSFAWEEDVGSRKRGRSWSDVFFVKLWSVPSVKLPTSGCTMKNVAVVSIGETKNLTGFIEENPFEEAEYNELAMVAMKKFPTSLLRFDRYTLENMESYTLACSQFRRLVGVE